MRQGTHGPHGEEDRCGKGPNVSIGATHPAAYNSGYVSVPRVYCATVAKLPRKWVVAPDCEL
jgi:hypothetical protein